MRPQPWQRWHLNDKGTAYSFGKMVKISVHWVKNWFKFSFIGFKFRFLMQYPVSSQHVSPVVLSLWSYFANISEQTWENAWIPMLTTLHPRPPSRQNKGIENEREIQTTTTTSNKQTNKNSKKHATHHSRPHPPAVAARAGAVHPVAVDILSRTPTTVTKRALFL